MDLARPFAGCDVLDDMFDLAGVGISLAGQPMHASSSLAHSAEARQYVLGEGPMLDAYRTRQPVEAPDTRDDGWLGLDLHGFGIGGVSSEPLVVGDVCLGAMTLYQPHPGEPGLTQRLLAHLTAGHIALAVAALVVAGHETNHPHPALRHLDELHEAVGVVIAQLAVSADEASARLRAHVYQSGRPLHDVVRGLRNHSIQLPVDVSPGPR